MTDEAPEILNEELFKQFCDALYDQDLEEKLKNDDLTEYRQKSQALAVLLSQHFKKYIPEADPLNFSPWSSRFVYMEAMSLTNIVDVKKTLAELHELKRCLLQAKRLLDELPFGARDVLRKQAGSKALFSFEKPTTQNVNKAEWDESSPQYSAYRLILAATAMLPYFTPVLEQAIKHVEQHSTPIGRKAMNAWHVVDAAAALCESMRGTIKVPKAMGPSGEFYRLLIDLFDFFGIEEDPVNVTRNWAKHVGR